MTIDGPSRAVGRGCTLKKQLHGVTAVAMHRHAGHREHPLIGHEYLGQHPDVVRTIFLAGMFGTFGLNFPIVLTAMAKSTFHGNATTYGLFNIALAIGSAAGALFAGAAARPKSRMLVLSAAAFGLLQVAAAVPPDLALFLVLLGAMGLVNLAFQSMANASVQLATDPRLRGRVMGLYMLAFIGGTPIGAPLIGALTIQFGARVGMTVCGAVPALAAAGVQADHLRPGVTR
jgi:MFS family permease